ncbi:MAG: GAF domain-containing protein, partial [Thermoleophilaceae bacterium]|nr:GAF domain-containing protein [Thermoleophilaceae bacterium]
VGLASLRSELVEERLGRRLLVFGRIHEALGRLRGIGTTDAMIRRAPEQVAWACDFDRVALYRVDEGLMVCEGFYIVDDPERAAEMLDFSRANPAPLRDQILETEMIRHHRPVVVHDALNHPSTYKPLVEHYATHAYVAAPIMPEGRVIGFLHGEKGIQHPGDTKAVDDFDRDAIWAFAEGLGFAVERMQLLDRLRAQGQELRGLISKADSVVAAQLAAQVELVAGPVEAGAARSAAALFGDVGSPLEARLTRREREVLELVARGATNNQIADKLVIAEATAKSHLKRIMRKLGAANRVEAASMYLRARSSDD